MFSPNKKRPQLPKDNRDGKPVSAEAKKRMWTVVGLTLALLFLYYGGVAISLTVAKIVMIVYFVAFAAIILTYLAYNRAFVNKDVTVDMLPDDWSLEKKQAFVDGNRRREEKSRWMVMLIIPFVVVFMCEALYLFLWDGYLAKLFME